MKKVTLQWLKIAQSDFESALYLFDGARYPQSIYFICQAIEKLLKGCQVELTELVPQKTHRLENIAKKIPFQFNEQQLKILENLSRDYNRVRYPDISQISYNTKKKTTPIINMGKEIYLWIKNQLKDQS